MSFTSNFLEELEKKRKERLENAKAEAAQTMLYKNKTATAEDIAPVSAEKAVADEFMARGYAQLSEEERAELERSKARSNATWFKSQDIDNVGDFFEVAGASAGDVGVGLGKGLMQFGEGLSDLFLYGVSGVSRLFGADDFADEVKATATFDTTDYAFSGMERAVDDRSVFGEKSDSISAGLGYVGGIILTGGAGEALGLGSAGVSALTTGTTFAGSMGSGMSEAYQSGATDSKAVAYGAMKGAVEAGTELLFGGLGKSVKALGLSRGIGGLDDIFAKTVSNKISNVFVRNVVQGTIKAGGEAAEEYLAGLGSAFAKWLTYRSDEELGQLIEDENLLDQALNGFIISAISQAPSNINSSVKGQDFVTGMTNNEQAVVDKEVEKRIAEKEAKGEKVTGKDKTKIYDSVVKDLEKGYISTDTIEEVLGGEDYIKYQRETKRQQELDDELNDLRNMKSGEMTDIQTERMTELKAMKPNTEMLNTLKFSIDENIRSGIKNSRLLESYNERARRGEAFTADLSKYDKKQQATVQRAIDSGVLNNSNRSHDLVDMIAKLESDKGVKFDFANSEKLKESGFALEGKIINGLVTKDGITLNIDSHKALDTVAGHEITHVLEGTELYGELQKAIFDYAKAKGEYQSRLDALTKLYKGIKDADVNKELTADLVGDYLFTDTDFINKLSTEHRNVFQKIYDEIKYLYKIATAGSKQARELERVKNLFEKAYKESVNTTEEVGKTTEESGIVTDEVTPAEEVEESEPVQDITADEGTVETPIDESVESREEAPTFEYHTPLDDIELLEDILEDTDSDSGTNADTKYSISEGDVKKPIDKYTEKQYNTFGWARDAEAISKNELDDMYSKIHEKGSLKKFAQSSKGEAIIEVNDDPHTTLGVDNVFVFVTGTKNNPQINKVVRFQVETDTEMEIIKEKLYERGSFSNTYYSYLEQYGLAREYSKKSALDYIGYKEKARRGSGGADSNRADGNGGIEQNGARALTETQTNEITPNKASSEDGVFFDGNKPKYSISDSDGKTLTKEQNEYFKDSKMRDENGNLKVMYHGSQDAGFHIFDSSMSDDGTSFFFVDRNDVAASYSGTSETYEAQTIHTAEDMNNFIEKIGAEGYEVVEKDGKFTLLYEGDRVADSKTAKGIYEEFCWYEGVGEGDANYKVYLNLKNPLVVDAEGRNWNAVTREYSQEVADRYNSLTTEEKAALADLAGWGEVSIFRSELQDAVSRSHKDTTDAMTNVLASAYDKLKHPSISMYDIFSIAEDNFSEESIKQFAVKEWTTRDYAAKAKAEGYDGVIFKNIHDNGGYSNGSEGASTVAVAFSSEQIKSVANEKPTSDPDIRYSLSEDSEGRQLSNAVKKRFGNSKVVDENGNLKVVYHGTASGEFSIFDKAKGSVEGDFGSGFYFTDNEADVSEHYEGGGPDFDNKVSRRAEQIYDEALDDDNEITYEEAEERAREELYKGSHKFEVYLNMENPATVGETILFDQESYLEQYNEEDYDDYDDYMGDVEQLITDDIDGIIWDIERNVDIDSTDGIANVLYDAVAEGGIGLEQLKKRLNDLYLEDSNGQLVANEVARQIIESLGYDGIIDPTVSGKWNMDIEPGTTHYIVFKPNQIKAVTNENPTDNPDIHRSLSAEGDTSRRYGNIFGEDVRFNAPVAEDLTGATETAEATENTAPIQNVTESENEAIEDIMPEGFAPITEEEAEAVARENFESLDDADAPVEVDTEYYSTPDNTRVDDKAVKGISESLADVLALEANETEAIGDVVQRYSTGEISEAELFDEIKSRFGERIIEYVDEQTVEVKRALRRYKLFVSDTIKGDIPEYNNLRKKLWGRLFTKKRENGGIPVDTAYMELSELYPGYFPEDIINPTEQFLLMAQYAQDKAISYESYRLDDEDIQEAVDIITSEVGKSKEAALEQSLEEDRRALMDEIAPVIEKTPDKAYEAIRPPKQSAEPQMKRTEPRMKRADSTKTALNGMEERSWYETSTGSEAVDNMVTPDDIPDDVRYYQVKSNEKTLATANARLARDGYAKSREYFEGRMSERKLSVEDIALGERLIQEAAKAGDAKAVRDLIIDVSIIGTELGQRVQALSMIRRLTPEGQLKALTRTVERGKAKGDKAFEGVEITQEMIDYILKTYGKDGTFDQTELNAAVEDVKQQIADQMSVGAMDYINAWRYLAMLGNPKTHIRNIVSNVAMLGTRTVKNAIARTIETIAPIKNRTKTWKRASDVVKSFAEQTTKEMESAIKGENKYSDEGGIKAKRNVFKTKAGNRMANANNNAMEFEDAIFSKSAFRSTLSEYLTANGIKTDADIKNNPALVEKAKDFALEEAHRATFRQDSYLANKISEIERKNPVLSVAVGSIMPFKKTPINIAKTGLAYSPLGFARNIYDAVQVGKGKMDASEAIDHLAQTLTGTSLALIGYALAEAGLLNGAGDDDKEGKYDYQLGEQSYSFNFGGDSFSLSWLSPVAMPLFVGANAYEQLVEGKEWNPDVVTEALAQTLDPLSEMSFISSLNDVLSSYDSGVAKIWGAGESMIQNYATQFVPTLSSQIAQTADDTKRSTKVAGDSTNKFGDGLLNQIKYKIPGLRNTLEPTTDIWGNEVKQSDNMLERGFEAFLSPANKRDGIATAVDEELKELYGQVGESELLPAIPDNYINYEGDKYEMSARDYTEYKEAYGQTAFELMEKLFDTETYKNADSETRADMVNRVYDYARDEAKLKYFTKFGVDYTNATLEGEGIYKENPIKGAIEADLPVDEYVFSTEYPERYAFFKDNGISYATYRAADEDGKRAYTWAAENPEKYTLSKAVADDVVEYRRYAGELYDIKADKDSSGKSITGSRKEKVLDYINGLDDLDYGARIILFKSEYKADDTYNYDIIDYLNGRDDISYEEMVTILKELDFTVDKYGNISWD